MKIKMRVLSLALTAAFFVGSSLSIAAQAPAKRKVVLADDLPRFTYPVSGPPSKLLMADDERFNALAVKVQRADTY